MTVAGRKLNGKVTIGVVLTPLIAWAVFVTYGTITNAAWIDGHKTWTDTAFAGVLRDMKRLEDGQNRMNEKLDAILERLAAQP